MASSATSKWKKGVRAVIDQARSESAGKAETNWDVVATEIGTTDWNFLYQDDPLPSAFRTELEARGLMYEPDLSAKAAPLFDGDDDPPVRFSEELNKEVRIDQEVRDHVKSLFQDTFHRLHALKERARLEELELRAPNIPKMLTGQRHLTIQELTNIPTALRLPISPDVYEREPPLVPILHPVKPKPAPYGDQWYLPPHEWSEAWAVRSRKSPSDWQAFETKGLRSNEVASVMPPSIHENDQYSRLFVNRSYKEFLIRQKEAIPEDLRNVQTIFDYADALGLDVNDPSLDVLRTGTTTWSKKEIDELRKKTLEDQEAERYRLRTQRKSQAALRESTMGKASYSRRNEDGGSGSSGTRGGGSGGGRGAGGGSLPPSSPSSPSGSPVQKRKIMAVSRTHASPSPKKSLSRSASRTRLSLSDLPSNRTFTLSSSPSRSSLKKLDLE